MPKAKKKAEKPEEAPQSTRPTDQELYDKRQAELAADRKIHNERRAQFGE